jgi:hypothetical protein
VFLIVPLIQMTRVRQLEHVQLDQKLSTGARLYFPVVTVESHPILGNSLVSTQSEEPGAP